jgi:hypothetical protein
MICRGPTPARRRSGWLLGRLIGRSRDRLVLDPDGLKAVPGDTQGTRTVVIAPPHRERATRLDLLDETLGQKLGDDLAGGTAGQI